MRYKELGPLYWGGGAGQIPLRLIVLAPRPYRKRKSSRKYYHRPAYLFTTDLKSAVKGLPQIYIDRWQIEVDHRVEKDALGVGRAQLWNQIAVPKPPALAGAAYSALLLAGWEAFGAERGRGCAPLPKWRRTAQRPSGLDWITLLRKEMAEHPELTQKFACPISDRGLTAAAAA